MKIYFLYIWLNINFDSADEGQNWDMVMFLVTTLEMKLMGLKKNQLFSFSTLRPCHTAVDVKISHDLRIKIEKSGFIRGDNKKNDGYM